MSEVTVYVVRAVSMFAPNSQSARLAGSESKMERVVLAADHDRIVAEAEARGWNAGLSDPAVREQIIKTLMDEGSESEGGWHSWRCHDKSRYPGPCGCTPAIVDALLAALRKPEVEG